MNTTRRWTAIALTTTALAACSSASPSASALPSSAEPAPSLSAAPATELARTSDPLPAGRYTRESFRPRVTFELDGSWYGVQLLTGFFDVQQDVGSPDVIAVQFAKPSRVYGAGGNGVLVEDAATAVGAMEASDRYTVVETSEPQIGGLSGRQLTIENASGANQAVMRVPPGTLTFDDARKLQITFIDTPDGLLAIMVGGSIAKWQEAMDAATPVLESVTIGQ